MITKDFVLAGKSIFTVEIPTSFTEKHKDCPTQITYRVQHSEANKNYPETWFLQSLTGPDNTKDYSYLGILNSETGQVRLTGRSRWQSDTWVAKIAERVLVCLWKGDEEKIVVGGWDVHHEGRCGRCGRVLTTPESCKTGIGPECARIMGVVREEEEPVPF